jgi:lysophospholipase L1-like esterase
MTIAPFLSLRTWAVSFFAFLALLYCHAQSQFDGIVCWGDSKTEGGQEPGISYPGILQELLQQEGYQIKVFNFGANGERTTEIMQRQGSYPFIVQPFTIPASASKEVKIAINSRLRVPEAGCNPCYIAGVEGCIRHDWSDQSQTTFYFQRKRDGKEILVSEPAQIETDAMRNHRNDLMILDIGYNGGFIGIDNWVEQHFQMIDYSDCKNYIVMGRASHYYTESPDLEQKFAQAFGNRYINLCKYYIEEGLQKAEIEPTAGDLADISARRPPRSLFLDEHHENHFGYAIKAYLVFEKLKELGYISPVASINIQETHPSPGTIYNLQGQKIDRVTKSGIYIINGKKIFIKL